MKCMQEATFNVETITPLFLAGADQGTAELRAPSFRGAMRYWFRALVGGMTGTGTNGLEEVIKAEADVFGATDQGSSVRVKVSEASRDPEQFTERTNIQVRGEWKATGKGYLLWSMVRSGNPARRNEKPARWYFPRGTQFQFTLSTKRYCGARLPESSHCVILAFNSVRWSGTLCSRRCGGSLVVTKVVGNTSNLPFSTPETAQTLKQQIEQGIKTARTFLHVNPHQVTDSRFDALARGNCRIWILQENQVTWKSPDEAMRIIGERLQDFRSTIPIQQRKVFGLPLKGINGRQSSPLHLRVIKLQPEKYVGIATLFKTSIPGIPMGDYKHIENWVSTSFPNALEVLL